MTPEKFKDSQESQKEGEGSVEGKEKKIAETEKDNQMSFKDKGGFTELKIYTGDKLQTSQKRPLSPKQSPKFAKGQPATVGSTNRTSSRG